MVNPMVADTLVMQEAKASAALVLTELALNILVLAPNKLIN